MQALAPTRAARACAHRRTGPHRLLKRARTAPTTPFPLPAAAAAAAAAAANADPTPPLQSTPTATPAAAQLVDRVLAAVAGTDGGVAISPQLRDEVDALLDELDAEHGARKVPRPLDDPLLVGDYGVAYTSTSRAPSERGQPAGGRFRGRIGRALFRTTGVFQSVLPLPPGEEEKKEEGEGEGPAAVALAVNKVAFRLFGLIPGYVGLRGWCYPCPRPNALGTSSNTNNTNTNTKDGDRSTVRVLFERPVLSLGPLTARIGPPSSVVLTTTYLDERVRLGRGSRGSLFVFTRGGAAEQADMASVGLEKASGLAKAAGVVILAAMVAGGAALWRCGATLAAAAVWLVAAGLAAVTYQGGIERDDGEAFGGGQRGRGVREDAAAHEVARLERGTATTA